MNTSHNASDLPRLIQDLKAHIATNQSQIHMEDPKLKHLEMEIAREKAALAKKEGEAAHTREHIEHLRNELVTSEREFRELQTEIQKMNLGGGHQNAFKRAA